MRGRIFDWLLRLYPPAFRATFAADMAALFRAQCDDVLRARGRLGLWWFCSRTFVSVALAALYERVAEREEREGRPKHREGVAAAFVQDVRYAVRLLVNNPGFSLLAVATLALGIGVNTTLFSLVNEILLAKLPVTDRDRFVLIETVNDPGSESDPGAMLTDYAVLARESKSFAGIAVGKPDSFVLTSDRAPMRVQATRVSDNFFRVWGVRPTLGRDFLEGEDGPGAPRVIILSHGFWSRQFGRDVGILGESLRLDGEDYVVVGVHSPAMEYGTLATVDIWVPLRTDPTDAGTDRTARLSARLKPGVSFGEAREETAAIAERLAELHPDTHRGWTFRVLSVSEAILDGGDRALIAVLFVTVGFVLLIACANVANLFLTKATGRSKEIAVRIALGAGRIRLVRQLFTEACLIAMLGAGLGLLLARGLLDVLVVITSEKHLLFRMADLDAQVLAFTAAIAALTPLLFALFPSVHATRPDIQGMLKAGGGYGHGRRALGSRGFLVGAQLALALTLMIVISLLLRSMVELRRLSLGIDQEGVITAQLDLPETAYADDDSRRRFYRSLVDRVDAMPGTLETAVVSEPPLAGFGAVRPIELEGQDTGDDESLQLAHFYTCSPRYFATVGIPLRSGRAFTRADTGAAPRVAIVNETAASRYWPKGDPLGHRLRSDTGGWAQVVGVVGDVLNFDKNNLHVPQIYLSSEQEPRAGMALIARVAGEPSTFAEPIRKHVWALDPDQPVDDVRTLGEIEYDTHAESYALMTLFIIFGIFALVMASTGVYGVMSYAVSQRRQEIGVRMALGARMGDVQRLVLRAALKVVVIGMAAGMVSALLVRTMLSSLVFGIDTLDPWTFAGVPLLLTSVALVASYVPARRASHIDPVATLRSD